LETIAEAWQKRISNVYSFQYPFVSKNATTPKIKCQMAAKGLKNEFIIALQKLITIAIGTTEAPGVPAELFPDFV
jgi:hypothetical protein